MRINSIDKDIHSLLSSSYYMIPRFQRPYSWDKENVQEFWNDTIANREDEYFIGSIVVFSKADNTYGVVDGQQRLSTITMLLCAIRDAYKEQGFDDLSRGVHSLVERKDISNRNKYILQTETSFPFFQEYIQKYDKPEVRLEIRNEEKAIEIAFREIRSFISQTIESLRIDPSLSAEKRKDAIADRLNQFRDRILSLKVIFVELDNEDDAYLIFETLNTRGKDLSPSDLVKNLLSRYIQPSNPDVDVVKIKWQQIIETIENAPGEVSTNNFMHHYWLSKFEYTSAKKLYKSIRRYVTRDNANSFLEDLESKSSIYRYIFEPTYRRWRNDEVKIRRSLGALDLFNVRQPVPLLLSILSKYESGGLTKRQTAQILSAVESFIFKYTAIVTTQSTGGLSMMYSSYARRLSHASTGTDTNRVLTELRARLRELSPTLEEFIVSLRTIIYTNSHTKQRKLVRYILSRFHDQANPSHVIDYDLMTIEHLLPQSTTGRNGLTDEIVGCLGNLVLVSPEMNQKLSDKTFREKKVTLSSADYVLDDEVAKQDDWDNASIEARFQWMAGEAYDRHWRI